MSFLLIFGIVEHCGLPRMTIKQNNVAMSTNILFSASLISHSDIESFEIVSNL